MSKPNQLKTAGSSCKESAIRVKGVGIFTFRPYCPRNKSIQMQCSWTLLNYRQTLVQRFLVGSSRVPEVVKTVPAHTCTLRMNLMRRRVAVKIWRQMEKRQAVASLTIVEARINLIGRTKSARTTSFGIFQEPQSTSMKSATFSKSPSRLTSHLYASQALCQEPLPKQSSVSFAGSAST
jgi:hypothetical protein